MKNSQKQNRKIENPILRYALYVIIPVAVLVALYFLGIGAKWLLDLITNVGAPVIITFVVTSIFWNVFHGWRELKGKNKVKESSEEGEEDEEDEDEF